MSEELLRSRSMIEWMAQTTHQAYHTDSPATWRECKKDICSSAVKFLNGELDP